MTGELVLSKIILQSVLKVHQHNQSKIKSCILHNVKFFQIHIIHQTWRF